MTSGGEKIVFPTVKCSFSYFWDAAVWKQFAMQVFGRRRDLKGSRSQTIDGF